MLTIAQQLSAEKRAVKYLLYNAARAAQKSACVQILIEQANILKFPFYDIDIFMMDEKKSLHKCLYRLQAEVVISEFFIRVC